ncbi:hypothetical protein BT93_C0710 [Corymbia citriodora subsp. variegata]|nr:hypothetical protein BT93_C0710 [Corymbia citriodora subsp. variegata]KAF8034478.1 hypothetical protein BT93_C0710 [Corymbia citriodora subsp. variegata]
MANSLCFAPTCFVKPPPRVGAVIGSSIAGKVLRVNEACIGTKVARFRSLEVKAAEDSKGTKPRSIVCTNCDGNGAVQCSQCKGTGVNSVDHFNGQFKAGGICWLCRGKKEMLCGDCNGAGFLGGFMSTFDE